MRFQTAAIALTLFGALGAVTTACATRTDGEPAPPSGFFSGTQPDSIDPTLAQAADAGSDASTGPVGTAWQVGIGRPTPVLHKLYTEHLGEWLRDEPTHSASFGLLGADIGLSLRQFGQQVFFFGDSFAANPAMENTKTVATIPLGPPPDVLDLPKLVFPLDSTGVFTPVSLPGLSFGPLTVPWGSIALGNSTYVYYAAAWDPTTQTQTQSALAHTQNGAFTSMQLDYDVPSTHFIGVQALEAGDDVLLFGEGPYRQSALYLATVPKKQIANHSAWRYFAGQGDAGCPTFSSSEADAVPIIPSDCIGEFSVMRSFELGGYVVTYNCFDTNERGIFMQMAPTPLGPWSAPVKILDPEFDSYTKFIHANPQVIGFDDGLSDWGRETTFGFEYAPNLVPEWTRALSPGVFSIVYTLSSWNPYTLHLVHTVVGVDGTSASPTPRGVGLPKATLVNGDFGTGDLT
ncbi:MAG TPA: DUF4185 domain-containing protein, partial [Polyangiaceae bacterium]|nr:DUF4185 domain-containing protein [Polyangiaceae bacterium]